MNKVQLTVLVLMAVFGSNNLQAKEQKKFQQCDKTFNTAEWRSLNHDHCNSRNNPREHKIKPTNVAGLQLLWQHTEDPTASVEASPVIADGVVYYADIKGNVFARKASNGTLIWQTNVGAEVDASPLIAEEHIYIAANDIKLYKLRRSDGVIVASVIIDPVALATGQAGIQASPVIVDDLIIIGVSTGNNSELTTANIIFHGTLNAFKAGSLDFVWSFNPSPAKKKDLTLSSGVGIWSTPAIDKKRKLLYVGTGNTILPPAAPLSDSLLAIDFTTGTLVWQNEFLAGDVYGYTHQCGPDRDIGASPNLFTAEIKDSSGQKQARDLVGVCGKQGFYRAIDRDTGETVWETVISSTGTFFGNPSAAVNGNTIYVAASEDPNNLTSGFLAVQFQQFGVCNVLSGFLGLPCTGICNDLFGAGANQLLNAILGVGPDGVAPIGMVTNIKALNTANGKVKWTNVSPSVTFGSITTANGIVYQGNLLGQIRCLDAESGTLLKQINTVVFNFDSPFSISQGRLFIGQGAEGLGNGGIAVYSVP